MKGLSIEQKAKSYDEAFERVKELLSRCRTNRDRRTMVYRVEDIESIFPELAMSEDEKIKEDLIEWINDFPDMIWEGHYKKDVIAWLEKQESCYSFEIKKGHWYKCVCDYMLNNSDLMFKNDRLYYCRSDWRLRGEIDERNVKNIGVNGYKSFFRPVTNQEIKEWLEKQGEQKPTLPKWKYKNDNTPLLRDSLILNKYGCVAKSPSGAFVNDVWVIDYDELAKLPKEELEKQGEQETLCDKCRKEHPSHSCQDITELGRCSVEHEQKTDNSYCQENCKGFQETGKCFADGDCKAKREAETTNKVEPKFKVGDWVIYNNDICQIVKREEGCNILVTQFGVEKEPVNERNLSTAKLWDISDARDCDILAGSKDEVILIFRGIGNTEWNDVIDYHCCYDCYRKEFIIQKDLNFWGYVKDNELKPVTKEQRDFLFQKIKEAGYVWDSEKKELRKGE